MVPDVENLREYHWTPQTWLRASRATPTNDALQTETSVQLES